MLSIEAVARVGGLFSLLTLAHFIADWVFQSHSEAMAKSTDSWIRAKHCLVYTVLLSAVLWLLFQPSFGAMSLIAVTLWFSHFVEDTYLPVYVWAKYIRKPLEMEPNGSIEGFKTFASTALGKILLITLDQVVHLCFLVPVAAVVAYPAQLHCIAGYSFFGLGILWAIGLWGKLFSK